MALDSRLRAWLNSTKLQVSSAQDFNRAALYQTIKMLIDQVDILQANINAGVSGANTIQNISQITQILDLGGSSEGSDEGPMGPPGLIGSVGPTGPAGLIGPMGMSGEDGEDSYIQLISSGGGGGDVFLNAANVFTDTNTFDESVIVNHGIEFPSTPFSSAFPNVLDEYEEGTWTPTDDSGAGLSFTSPAGQYVKIGKNVFISWQLRYPSTANGSAAQIGGLPFSCGFHSAASLGFVTTGTPCYLWISTSPLAIFPLAQAGGANILNSQCSLAFLYGAGAYVAVD